MMKLPEHLGYLQIMARGIKGNCRVDAFLKKYSLAFIVLICFEVYESIVLNEEDY